MSGLWSQSLEIYLPSDMRGAAEKQEREREREKFLIKGRSSFITWGPSLS